MPKTGQKPSSPREDATGASVGRVAVPKTGQKSALPREDATEASVGRVAVPKTGREPDHNPVKGTDFLSFDTRPCPRSASVEGPRAKVPIEALFATRGCH
ncbi:MAG: hypothetical protein KIG67_04500 [Bacteroidales bacterium]|nr:hypothetical protein [Bacteroidales bacterium]